MNFEWVKKHPYATGAAVLAGLVVIFVFFRSSGSGSSGGIASVAADQEQGQLQMAELSSQESAQQDQLNAQLASQEYATSASEQQNQDQLASTIASQILPEQIQSEFESPIYSQELSLYGEELNNQASEQNALLPLEQSALKLGSNPNMAATGETLLAELMGEGASNQNKYGSQTFLPSGSTTTLPFGLPSPSTSSLLGTGLFA